RAGAFWLFQIDRGLWRYASITDLQAIVRAVVVSSGIFAFVITVSGLGPYPRSIYLIDTILLVAVLGGVRLARRSYRELTRSQNQKRVLIYGAGDAGEMIVRDMRNNRFYECEPIGFIDDDARKVGRTIHGVNVLGTRTSLPRLLDKYHPDEVLVAVPSA